jgi:hypothetical protein
VISELRPRFTERADGGAQDACLPPHDLTPCAVEREFGAAPDLVVAVGPGGPLGRNEAG